MSKPSDRLAKRVTEEISRHFCQASKSEVRWEKATDARARQLSSHYSGQGRSVEDEMWAKKAAELD